MEGSSMGIQIYDSRWWECGYISPYSSLHTLPFIGSKFFIVQINLYNLSCGSVNSLERTHQ